MKNLPIYENLDTSFVNLSALMRYLRQHQFVGQVRVKLHGYAAEITLDAENRINVHEHDQIAGRIAEGDEAFRRLLIRARESGGTINVYRFVETDETFESQFQSVSEQAITKPLIGKEFLPAAPGTNGNGKQEKILDAAQSDDFLNLLPKNHSPLPFEFTNRVEERARQTQDSPEDRETFLQFVGELFGAVEDVFNRANLDFTAALTKARREAADDYPFLNPSSGIFDYNAGKAELHEEINTKLFAASINESLRHILDRLDANPEFTETYRDAAQKISVLIYRHKTAYDKFIVTPQLEKILDI